MKPKTLLYVLIAIAVVAVGAFLVYQLIARNTNGTNGTGQTGSLPNTAGQQFPVGISVSSTGSFNTAAGSSSSVRFGIVSNEPVSDYFISNANVVTVIKPDGTIDSITNSVASTISTTTFKDVVAFAFSYDGKKILISARTETTTRTSVFDITAKSWTTLPVGMISPVWSPNTYQIAYFTNSNIGTETLSNINVGIANAKPTILSTFTMEDSLASVAHKNTFIISDRSSAFMVGSAWSFDTTNKCLIFCFFRKSWL